MLKLSEGCENVPSTLLITGVNNHGEHPIFYGGFGDVFRASYRSSGFIQRTAHDSLLQPARPSHRVAIRRPRARTCISPSPPHQQHIEGHVVRTRTRAAVSLVILPHQRDLIITTVLPIRPRTTQPVILRRCMMLPHVRSSPSTTDTPPYEVVHPLLHGIQRARAGDSNRRRTRWGGASRLRLRRCSLTRSCTQCSIEPPLRIARLASSRSAPLVPERSCTEPSANSSVCQQTQTSALLEPRAPDSKETVATFGPHRALAPHPPLMNSELRVLASESSVSDVCKKVLSLSVVPGSAPLVPNHSQCSESGASMAAKTAKDRASGDAERKIAKHRSVVLDPDWFT
ncbi:hypothetical protein DFH09DRAFT_1315685 [Mycena vulgaris]|nr:hypothetical protein DFH09DRAFT_1315685 [Mycena vulgaris]